MQSQLSTLLVQATYILCNFQHCASSPVARDNETLLTTLHSKLAIDHLPHPPPVKQTRRPLPLHPLGTFNNMAAATAGTQSWLLLLVLNFGCYCCYSIWAASANTQSWMLLLVLNLGCYCWYSILAAPAGTQSRMLLLVGCYCWYSNLAATAATQSRMLLLVLNLGCYCWYSIWAATAGTQIGLNAAHLICARTAYKT